MTHIKHINKLYMQNAGLLIVTAGKVTNVVQRDSQTQNVDSDLGNVSLLMGRDLTEEKQKYSCTLSVISALDEGGWSNATPWSHYSQE